MLAAPGPDLNADRPPRNGAGPYGYAAGSQLITIEAYTIYVFALLPVQADDPSLPPQFVHILTIDEGAQETLNKDGSTMLLF